MSLPTYPKNALDIPSQLFLLESRGVVIEDMAFARRVLENVSFYRFRAYLFPFLRKDGSGNYAPEPRSICVGSIIGSTAD